MSVEWKLELVGGEEKSFPEWGLENDPVLSLVSLEADRLTFTHRVGDIFKDPTFPFESTVRLKRYEDGVGTTWFVGVVMEPQRSGSATEEVMTYEVLGPWYWLEHRQHKQPWKTYDTQAEAVVTKWSSSLMLGIDVDGTKLTTGEVIQEVLDRMISLGAPIAYDAATFPAVDAPVREARELTAAQVIREVLRWSPDAVGFWDYSTNPDPTFCIRTRENLVATTLPLATDPTNVAGVRLRPMRELQVPEVYLQYRKTHEVGTGSFNTLDPDFAPNPGATGDAHRGINLTIELAGSQVTYVTGELQTAKINANAADEATRKAWWQERLSWLQGAVSFTVDQVTRNSPSGAGPFLPREITGGTAAPWMRDDEGTPITTRKERITAKVSYVLADGTIGEREVSEDLTATNGESRVYSTIEQVVYAEPTPVGLAESIYNALSVLQWQGELTLSEQECSGLVGLGQVLNLTGGHADWATMAAMVHQVTFDLENGRTSVALGPHAHLTVPDQVELLRVNRTPLTWTNALARTQAVATSRSQVEMPDQTPREKSVAKPDTGQRVIVREQSLTYPDHGQIDLDARSVRHPSTNQALTIAPRLTYVCVEDGQGGTVERAVILLRTEDFAP